MDEIWRVLAPGGLLYAVTPAYPHAEAFQDPTHVNIITDHTHDYFCGAKPLARMYGFGGRFEMRRLEWVAVHQAYTAHRRRRRPGPGGWRTACATQYASSGAGRSDAAPICSGSWKPSRHGMASPRPNRPNMPMATPSARPSHRACVLLLAYNQQETIESAIDSVLGQQCEPIEIVLSDDASSDCSFELMQAAAERYRGPHSVRARRNATNLGIGQHYNELVRATRAPLLVTAAGDDISTPIGSCACCRRGTRTGSAPT